MGIVTNLLVLYAGLVLINTALSTALWLSSRDPLHRTLVLVWASTLVSYVLQGLLVQNELVITYAFSSVFLVNLALARLVAGSLELNLPWRPFVAFLVIALAATTLLAYFDASFTTVALPTAVAVALPALTVAIRSVRRWRFLSVVTRVLVASCVLFSLHNLDFAFLRDRPEMAPLGFTLATLIIFAISITAPAVVLENVTERQARTDAELQAARHIQRRLLPTGARPSRLELVTHMRSAESVGGDYFDVRIVDDGCWIFLGDVTGHGLGAGLVALMVQSTMTTLIEARPDVSPRDVTFIANRVLADNLERLGENRHMTFVALRFRNDGTLVVSGSHDSIFIHRASSGEVDTVELAHFPLGLGFMNGLGLDSFGEDLLHLTQGDLLFLGSDGVTEAACNGDYARGMFGEERLIAFLRSQGGENLEDIKERLVERLDKYTGGAYHDDASFVIVRSVPTATAAELALSNARTSEGTS